MSRYRFIIAAVFAALLVAALFIYVGFRNGNAPTQKVTVGGTTHQVTPTAKLSVRTAEGQPTINLSTYRLKVTGLVYHTLSLSFDQIKAMPAVERFVKLPCVEGWTDQAVWKGPRLSQVLKLSLIHISEPTRLGMISYAVFCLKKKKKTRNKKT